MFALFIPALIGALAVAMGSFIGRALLVLGVGFTTYKGIDLALDLVKQQAISGVSGLTGDALGLVGYLWLDKGLTLVFSAIVAAMTMKMVGGSLKKMVLK